MLRLAGSVMVVFEMFVLLIMSYLVEKIKAASAALIAFSKDD